MDNFQQEYSCSFWDNPMPGELWEYQISPNEWIACEIVNRYEYRGGFRYTAKYINSTGKIKIGAIDRVNLREIKKDI